MTMSEGQGIFQEPARSAGEVSSVLYNRFAPTLVSFLMWQGARLPQAADIVQMTMGEACRRWSLLCEPDTWARRAAFREPTRRIGLARQEPADNIPGYSSLLAPLVDSTAWEQQCQLLGVLGLLSLRQRHVVLDLAAGSTGAMIPAQHAGLAADLRGDLDVEAGLSAIVSAIPAPD
jgi:DNA-directed RNA polymerase specialized sigma24 family protein